MDIKKKKFWGWICLSVFAILILSGIIAKRLYGLPDSMVFFHFPAAFFLVFSFNLLSHDIRNKRKVEEKRFRK